MSCRRVWGIRTTVVTYVNRQARCISVKLIQMVQSNMVDLILACGIIAGVLLSYRCDLYVDLCQRVTHCDCLSQWTSHCDCSFSASAVVCEPRFDPCILLIKEALGGTKLNITWRHFWVFQRNLKPVDCMPFSIKDLVLEHLLWPILTRLPLKLPSQKQSWEILLRLISVCCQLLIFGRVCHNWRCYALIF